MNLNQNMKKYTALLWDFSKLYSLQVILFQPSQCLSYSIVAFFFGSFLTVLDEESGVMEKKMILKYMLLL